MLDPRDVAGSVFVSYQDTNSLSDDYSVRGPVGNTISKEKGKISLLLFVCCMVDIDDKGRVSSSALSYTI